MASESRWTLRAMALPKRLLCVALLPAALLFVSPSAHSQIYTCTTKDGTRVFSDEKCGSDAKVVDGTGPARSAIARTVLTPASQAAPSEASNPSSDAAPSSNPQLKAEVACDGGSLSDCEERYCRDGATEECRTRVLQTAKISGETWYLREQGPVQENGAIAYKVRCITMNKRDIRDLTITCAAASNEQRCSTAAEKSGYPRLDRAASGYCGGK